MAPADSSPWRVFFLNYLSSDEHFETCAKNQVADGEMFDSSLLRGQGAEEYEMSEADRKDRELDIKTHRSCLGRSPTDLWQKCLKKSLDISQVMSSWRGALLEMREGEKTRIWVPASRPSELEFGKLSERGLLGQVNMLPNKRRLHLTYEIGFKAVEILHNEFSQLLSQPRSICFWKKASSSIQSPIV